MFGKFVLALGTIIAAMGVTTETNAGERFVPNWMKSDAARKVVTMQILAGYNGNNGAWNFNGYYNGTLNVVVPLGWTVKIEFATQDAQVPHSLVVTRPYAEGEFPDKVSAKEAAIKRAYTRSPSRGLRPPGNDTFRFKTRKPGKYYLTCGVAGHGAGGMWDQLEVSADAEAPYATIDKARLEVSDQPGRK